MVVVALQLQLRLRSSVCADAVVGSSWAGRGGELPVCAAASPALPLPLRSLPAHWCSGAAGGHRSGVHSRRQCGLGRREPVVQPAEVVGCPSLPTALLCAHLGALMTGLPTHLLFLLLTLPLLTRRAQARLPAHSIPVFAFHQRILPLQSMNWGVQQACPNAATRPLPSRPLPLPVCCCTFGTISSTSLLYITRLELPQCIQC